MWSKAFWQATLERAIKTFAQTALTLVIGNQANLPVIGTIDWLGVLGASGIAALLSILTSLGSSVLTPGAGPSAVNAEVLSPPAPPPVDA